MSKSGWSVHVVFHCRDGRDGRGVRLGIYDFIDATLLSRNQSTPTNTFLPYYGIVLAWIFIGEGTRLRLPLVCVDIAVVTPRLDLRLYTPRYRANLRPRLGQHVEANKVFRDALSLW